MPAMSDAPQRRADHGRRGTAAPSHRMRTAGSFTNNSINDDLLQGLVAAQGLVISVLVLMAIAIVLKVLLTLGSGLNKGLRGGR
jgi:hypothetical protein